MGCCMVAAAVNDYLLPSWLDYSVLECACLTPYAVQISGHQNKAQKAEVAALQRQFDSIIEACARVETRSSSPATAKLPVQ